MLAIVKGSESRDSELVKLRQKINAAQQGREPRAIRYSAELQEQVLAYWNRSGLGKDQIAQKLSISTSTVSVRPDVFNAVVKVKSACKNDMSII
jgi:DNA-binding NarL/FixJ family response regulator